MSRISIEFVFGFLFFFCFFFRKRQRKTSTASTQSATSARPSKKTKTSSVSEEPAQPAAAAPPTQLARLQVVPSFSFLFLPGFHPQPLSDIDTLSFVDSVGMYWETRSIGVVWLPFFFFFSLGNFRVVIDGVDCCESISRWRPPSTGTTRRL